MKKRIEDLVVIENKHLNKEFFVLKLQSHQGLPSILPGQFTEVKIEGSTSTFLRRPISIYDADYQLNTIDLLIKIVGDGSMRLSELKEHDAVNLIYPLGNSFSRPTGKKVLLVGGGTGVAPMLILGRFLLTELKVKPLFLLGYRSKELIIEKQRFESLGDVMITTEDGSEGVKGYVIDHPVLKDNSHDIDTIYTCGPENMMKAVARLADKMKISCEVSLENLMGCGIGVCLCCVAETKDKGNVNTCTEGPIFNSERLTWLT
jgi:dihydroorotate dehydrogenase electron transfer subunit